MSSGGVSLWPVLLEALWETLWMVSATLGIGGLGGLVLGVALYVSRPGNLVIPEALGPLILGFTFLFVAIVDMSAMAGAVAGGGLGDFALQYGYQRFDYTVTWLTVAVIVVVVQLAQLLGNTLARRVLRR